MVGLKLHNRPFDELIGYYSTEHHQYKKKFALLISNYKIYKSLLLSYSIS